ncbi:helix-turn-helix domain-containing protein [Candidatus Enterococcus clewellii]|uniref:helix-turn-helix domain-containing protein n=1 Tax=Candidatus Enterococcus clewellii TaxID=1834193 RepID=UPI000A33CEFF|nr:helix-turn-helix domain-containing protein [Enterococcus sp. 9E7_DIV0242]
MKLTIDDLELDDSVFNEINSRIEKGVSYAFEAHEKRKNSARYMTKKEAAAYCGVSFNTLQRFISLGLKVIMIDGMTRIDKNDCDEFMQKNKK